MKCPTCGTENKSTNKACFRCGRVLDDSGFKPAGDVNSLWYNNAAQTAEKKVVRTPPPFWGDTKGKPNYEDQSDFIVLHDEASDSNAAQDLVDRGAPVPDNRQKLERVRGKREVRVIVPSRPAPRAEAPKNRRFRVKWPRLIASALVILALGAGVAYGGYWLYKLAVGSISQAMANNHGSAELMDPRVEKLTIDGDTWHRITFYGNDGDMVLVTDPKRSLPIQNGKAVLMLEDQSYITSDSKSDKVTVSLVATIVTKDGKDREITVQPYVIQVPLAPLKLVLPQEETVSTNSDSMLIKIKVTPGSTHVLIGDQNVTDHVSKDGFASATVSLKPNVPNTVPIVVETPRYRRNEYDLKVDCPVMAVAIQLDSTTLDDTIVADSKIAIKGSTVPGATVKTTAKLNGAISQNNSGIFSFTVVLKRWGWNDIDITAESGGQTTTIIHRVYHKPTLDGYSRKAWKLDDYSYLITSTDSLIGTVYQIQGVVMKKYDIDAYEYYLFNAGTPSNPMLVVVENTKEDDLKENQYYQLFADVTGVYDNHPVLTLRFLNELPMPSEYATSAPGEATATPEPTGTESP